MAISIGRIQPLDLTLINLAVVLLLIWKRYLLYINARCRSVTVSLTLRYSVYGKISVFVGNTIELSQVFNIH